MDIAGLSENTVENSQALYNDIMLNVLDTSTNLQYIACLPGLRQPQGVVYCFSMAQMWEASSRTVAELVAENIVVN